MITRTLLLAGGAFMALLAFADDKTIAPVGLQSNVVFSDYTPLSSSSELTRRLLSPLNALRVQEAAARSPRALRQQPIDLGHERFVLYVPPHAPPRGFALLVFVQPWNNPTVPPQWIPALDRHAVIFVSAADSGNDTDVLDRREPLALLAAQNILTRYPLDRDRVFIGGVSGGARVALRLALGYADLFRGAFLNAGSDPIGDAQIPLPPRELLQRFQESMRLVYVSGARDELHLDEDLRSRRSLQEWCVFDLVTEEVPWGAHALAAPASFERALAALDEHAAPAAGKLAACRARIEQALAALFKQVEDLRARGQRADARRLLEKIDARYGGWAAPRSIELLGK